MASDELERRRPVRQIAVPRAIRARSTLARIDYADAFLVAGSAAEDRSAEAWCHTVLQDAPLRVRMRLVIGWTSLGLRLGPPWSDGRVLGWQIRRRTPEIILLGAGSYIGMPGELLFERRPEGLLFATFVTHRNAAARAMWARVQDTHVRVVTSLLRRAAG